MFGNSWDENPDLICIDFALTDMSYDELLLRIQAFDPNLSVLVFKVKDENFTIELLKMGATDCILRNDKLPTLRDDYVVVVSDNGNSKIEKELKVIIELASVLSNENKIYCAARIVYTMRLLISLFQRRKRFGNIILM